MNCRLTSFIVSPLIIIKAPLEAAEDCARELCKGKKSRELTGSDENENKAACLSEQSPGEVTQVYLSSYIRVTSSWDNGLVCNSVWED